MGSLKKGISLFLAGSVLLLLPVAALPAETLRATPDSWPTFRGDGGLTGQAARDLPVTPRLAWTFAAGGAVKASPVIGSGRVVVGSMDGAIVCVSLASGKLLWRHDAGAAVEAPALIDGEAVYVATTEGQVLRLDAATGALAWRVAVGSRIAGSPNIHRQSGSGRTVVLVASYDGAMRALDAKNGSVAWTFQTDNYINGCGAVTGNIVVFGGCDAQVHLVSVLDGEEAASIDTGSYIPGSPAVLDGRAYAGNYGGLLNAIDLATAAVAWRYESVDRFAFFGSPAVSREWIVAASEDGRVHGIDARTGKERWTWTAGEGVDCSPVIAGSSVVIGTPDGRLAVLGLADGRELWSWDVGASVSGSPAVAGGMLVVAGEDGTIAAFGE